MIVSLCDKVSMVSDPEAIIKRPKDLYHVYLMASIMEFSIEEFIAVWKRRGRKFTSPPALLQAETIATMEEWYHRRFVIRDIVSFQEVHSKAVRFLEPILVTLAEVRDTSNLNWNIDEGWREE